MRQWKQSGTNPVERIAAVVAIVALACSPLLAQFHQGAASPSATARVVPDLNLSGVASGNSSTANSSGALTPSSPATIASFGNWPTYGQNGQHTDFMSTERTLATSNISQLVPVWSQPFKTLAVVEGSTAVVNGTVFVGDYHGNVTALNASSGREIWSNQLGESSGNYSWTGCFGAKHNVKGIAATPTLWNGTVIIPGGNGTLFGVRATDGHELWNVTLTNHTHDSWTSFFLWGSPLVYNGYIYIGTASGCDAPLIQGEVMQINANLNSTYPTHRIQHTFTVVESNSTASDNGGSVWSTPSVDPATNTIFLTTGNVGVGSPVPGTNYNWTQAVIRVAANDICSKNASGGCTTEGYYQVQGSSGSDVDFGDGATVFYNSTGATMVGALNKNGSFYAFHPSNLAPGGTGLSAWNDKIAASGAPAGKNIAPAAFDGSTLYVAGYTTTLTNNNTNCPYGAIRALNPNDGSQKWGECLRGFVHAGVTVANGLVYVAPVWTNSTKAWNTTIDVFNAATGALLYWKNLNGTVDGEMTVADGRLFVTVGNFWDQCGSGSYVCRPGYVYAFGLPLASSPIRVTSVSCGGTCNPQVADVGYAVQPNGGTPPYVCSWKFADGGTGTGCALVHAYFWFVASKRYNVSVTITDSSFESLTGNTSAFGVQQSCSPPSLCIGWITSIVTCPIFGVCPGTSGSVTLGFWTVALGGTAPYTYRWNFGDQGSSTQANPVHTYSEQGQYDVSLTITDSAHHQTTLVLVLTV